MKKYIITGVLVMTLSMGFSVYQMRGLNASDPISAGHYGPYWVEHTVIYGDTLAELAERYQSTVKAIAETNGIRNPNNIIPGTKILIPVKENLD